jgi:hypothetical protein
MQAFRWLSVLLVVGCAGAQKPAVPKPLEPEVAVQPAPQDATCDTRQVAIVDAGNLRAAPWSTAAHLTKNFPDGQISWLMRSASYDAYVVKPGATKWGRCNDTGCYVFAAPATVIHAAVAQSLRDGRHDPDALGKALGLPAANFEGPLRMMTLDLNAAGSCARLPVDSDPGVWKCKTPEDTDCFKFGGYTSGGVPEIIVIDAPVEKTTIEEVQ